MTIAVQIRNVETNALPVKVTMRTYSKGSACASLHDETVLAPGESRTFHVHLLRDIIVEEIEPTPQPR